MRRRLPVRWRLTLWSAALLAGALVAFGGGLYLVLRHRLYTGFDEQLLNQATLALAAVRIEDGQPTFPPGATSPEEGEHFLRLLDADRAPVVGTGLDSAEVPLDRAVAAAALAGSTRYSTVADEDGDALRIVTLPVRRGGDGLIVGVLQVGLDRDETDAALTTLVGILVLAGPLVLLAAAAGGYLLAGRALAPVAKITQLAGRIGGQDLHARLGLDLPDDELGRLARTFDAMLARIEDAFERQRRFTGDAAHELRTPLALMRSQIDLALARPRLPDEYRAALDDLDRDLRRVTGVVGTLLTLARADAGRLVPERVRFDLAKTVALVAAQYTPIAAEGDVALEADILPTPIVADEDLLVQLLVNLLDNALAHTPPRGRVIVGCRGVGDGARLWVADDGEGIAAEHQARVFDRFYRVDAGRARTRGGAGLGLAICRAITEAHGGTIALTSRLNRGTTVEVWLPNRT